MAAIEFYSKPDGYKQVGKDYQQLYFPKSNNKEALELIKSIPTIGYKEVSGIVSFDSPQTTSRDGYFILVEIPTITFGENECLFDIPNGCKYDAPIDVEEIVESEYTKLKEIIKQKQDEDTKR